MPLPFQADGGPATGTAGNRQAPDITPGTAKRGAQIGKKAGNQGVSGGSALFLRTKTERFLRGKKRAVPLSALLSLLCTHLFPADPIVLVLPFLPGSCDPSPHNTCSSAHKPHFCSIGRMESGKREVRTGQMKRHVPALQGTVSSCGPRIRIRPDTFPA